MDKTTKTILIILAAVFVLCICATVAALAAGLTVFGLQRSDTTSDVQVITEPAVRVGSEILDYQPPAGYNTSFSFHFGDITLIGHDLRSQKSHIILAQFPQGTSIDFDEIFNLIGQASNIPGSSWYDGEMNTIDRIPVTINGQDTTLIINEGESSEGVTYRMATANFKGYGGPAVLIVAGPLDEWDMG